jgi:single-strand DNA-binding protein
MANGINKVILLGNVGADPVTRYQANGSSVTTVTLATSDSWKDRQSGQLQERTEWHRVVFFGKVSEIAAQYLKKGAQCYVEGRLQTREWEKDGIKRYTTEIIVGAGGSLQLLGAGERGKALSPAPVGATGLAATVRPAEQLYQSNDFPFDGDDVPF